MNKQRLRRIADGQVLRLAVHHHTNRRFQITGVVYINMAETVRMTKHGNLTVLHDITDEGVASTGNNQVNQFVQLQHFLHIFPGVQQTAPTVRQATFPGSAKDH